MDFNLTLVVRDEHGLKTQKKNLEEMNSLLAEYYILLEKVSDNSMYNTIMSDILDMMDDINDQDIIITELENDKVWSY